MFFCVSVYMTVYICFSVCLCSLCVAVGIYAWRCHLRTILLRCIQHRHNAGHTGALLHGCDRGNNASHTGALLHGCDQGDNSGHTGALLHSCDRGDMSLNSTSSSSSSVSPSSVSAINRRDDTWYEVATCIARLGVVILYFFLCDRSAIGYVLFPNIRSSLKSDTPVLILQ